MKFSYLLCLLFPLLTEVVNAKSLAVGPTVEELRLQTAAQHLPEVVNRLDNRVLQFTRQLQQARNFTALTQIVIRHGNKIWQEAVASFANRQDFDDRPCIGPG